MGSLKKIFSTDSFTFNESNSTVQSVINYLMEKQPENSNEFDGKNIMIAINGKDSSALSGSETSIKSGDIITIIPIIHGGSNIRTQFKIDQNLIEVFAVSKSVKYDKDYLEKIRKKFPKLIIQVISSNYVLSMSHVRKIITLSLKAKKRKNLLSKKLETDILLRFAGTTQISDAIQRIGPKKNQNFVIIGIGKRKNLNELFDEIKIGLVNTPFKNSHIYLKKYFRINRKQIQAVDSSTSLEDLLVEKAAILV